MQEATHDAIPAQKVIFWLFVVLAFCTAAILLWFIQVSKGQMEGDAQALLATDPVAAAQKQAEIGPVLFRLHAALAGNLAAPVLVWFLLKGIAEPARRTYWFLVAPWAALVTFLVILLLLVAAGQVPLPAEG